MNGVVDTFAVVSDTTVIEKYKSVSFKEESYDVGPSKIESYCGIKFYRDIMGSTTHDARLHSALNLAAIIGQGKPSLEKVDNACTYKSYIQIDRYLNLKVIEGIEEKTILNRRVYDDQNFAVIWQPTNNHLAEAG